MAEEHYSLFERLRSALLEDIGAGDVTSHALVPEDRDAEAEVVAKAGGVLCGVKLLPLIFQMAEQLVSQQAAVRAWELHDADEAAKAGKSGWDNALKMREQQQKQDLAVTVLKKDSALVSKGVVVASIRGNARAILAGERVALNLLSHLSGIATLTSVFIEKIKHTPAKILDTRKTTPLWRDLEKYAVKCGGGENHRCGLHDMVLIKDNHLALWGQSDPAGAVNAARAANLGVPIEVEVVDLPGLKNVCEHSAPEMILLDNFQIVELQAAVKWCRDFFGGVKHGARLPLLEASGGVSLETIAAIAESGVDRISVGALTHSAKSLDFSLEIKL